MIAFTGELGKEFVEDQIVKVDELAKLAKITIPAGRAYFELCKTKRGKSVEGQDRFADMVSRKFSIQGYLNNTPVKIDYYQSRTGKKGEYKYNGNRLTVFRKSWARAVNTETAEGRELCLLFLLHPHCEQSPLRDPRVEPIWTMVDYEQRAKEANKATEDKHSVMTTIFASDRSIIMAKGIQALGQTIPDFPGDKGRATLELTKFLDKVGTKAFKQAWDDPTTMLRGTVRVAQEKGILQSQTSGGMILWKYKDREILEVPPAKDAERMLIEYLHKNPEVYDEILKKL